MHRFVPLHNLNYSKFCIGRVFNIVVLLLYRNIIKGYNKMKNIKVSFRGSPVNNVEDVRFEKSTVLELPSKNKETSLFIGLMGGMSCVEQVASGIWGELIIKINRKTVFEGTVSKLWDESNKHCLVFLVEGKPQAWPE